jgi:hypothetical protein
MPLKWTGPLRPVSWECGTCGKKRGPRHTCSQGTDFKARKRKAAADDRKRDRKAAKAKRAKRRKQAAADRRARDSDHRKAPRPVNRQRTGSGHEPGSCGDPGCEKYGCKAYFEGYAEGTASGYAAGHEDGAAEAASGDGD